MRDEIKEYQCVGCTNGGDDCFLRKGCDISCTNHVAGTTILGIGKIFLGLPKGFNRRGSANTVINIFEKFEDSWRYDKLNVPVWKYKNENNHTIIKGISPRINEPFIHIILEDCMDKIDCIEITDDFLKTID